MNPALMAAREHATIVARPRSSVFHLHTGSLTPSGRTPRGARPLCAAHTRPLTEVDRPAMRFDLGGLRMCARCSARLSAVARRAEQPPNQLDARAAFFAGISIDDLFAALAVASTVDDTYAVGLIANQLHGRVLSITGRRPSEPTAFDRYDLEVALIRRRDHLRAAEIPTERRAALAKQRADQAADDARIAAGRRRAAATERAIDRGNRGGYLTARERELVDHATAGSP